MKDNGVRRLICITSSALEPHETGGGFFFDNIMSPLVVNVFGKTLYADMRKMEELVMRSNLDWTIVRPSALFETPAVTDYQEGARHLTGTYTYRSYLSSSMLHQLTPDQVHHERCGRGVAQVGGDRDCLRDGVANFWLDAADDLGGESALVDPGSPPDGELRVDPVHRYPAGALPRQSQASPSATDRATS